MREQDKLGREGMIQSQSLPFDVPLPFEAQREEKRRLSNKAKVLARLQEGPATTRQLIEIGGTRAPGRVHELRGEGWIIDSDDEGRGLFVYRLRGRKEW